MRSPKKNPNRECEIFFKNGALAKSGVGFSKKGVMPYFFTVLSIKLI